MSVRMRLQRKGRKKQPFYHIVIADQRAPRDGKFIEKLGTYNPMTSPATINLDQDLALEWLDKGAQPSDTVRAILKFTGVLYKKHLQRGVKKGALTQEKADAMYAEFAAKKGEALQQRIEKTADEKAALQAKLFGKAPAPVKEEEE